MDNIYNKNNTNQADSPSSLEQGRWVAVDASSLGFQLNGSPNQPIQGPDGATYCMSESQPQLSGISANNNYAIPTPSSVVQMPPIVQPIALVPYTSQNQPLLQYDPYSRPVEPTVEPKAPNYVRKPYLGISLVAMILSIAGLLSALFLTIAAFKANDLRAAFNMNGLDAVKALLASAGVGGISSKYHASRIVPNSQQIPSDTLSTIITYAVPALVAVMLIIFALLMFKYIYKTGAKKSPRAFSFGAFINIIISISLGGILLGMTNAEVDVASRTANISRFFTLEASITMGIGLIIALALSIILFVIPFFARKNAYMLDKKDDASRTFIIKD